jgi:hypothetical protein
MSGSDRTDSNQAEPTVGYDLNILASKFYRKSTERSTGIIDLGVMFNPLFGIQKS